MNNLPVKFVLSIKPKEYLKQGPSHCGVYSVKGILSAYGLDKKSHPKYYHLNILSREISITWGKTYYTRIFSTHGINTTMKFAEDLSNNKRLHLLKHLLSQNTPVMIRIGNGYISDKYNPILGKLIPHWITLWGYDDKKGIFYVYDSGLPKKYWDTSQTVGNTVRTYQDIIRDWRFGRLVPWAWFVTGPHNFVYIEIKNI